MDEVSSLNVRVTELSSKASSMETQLESHHTSLKLKDAENSSLLSELGDLKTTFDDIVTEIS